MSPLGAWSSFWTQTAVDSCQLRYLSGRFHALFFEVLLSCLFYLFLSHYVIFSNSRISTIPTTIAISMMRLPLGLRVWVWDLGDSGLGCVV